MTAEPTQRTPPPHIPTRYGTAMMRRFGWFYTALGLGRMLGHLRFEPHSVERIRTASERGPVVFVLPRRSTSDHLALNAVLNRYRLPLSVWANGAVSFFWQPVGAAWADVAHRVRSFFRDGPAPDPVASGWVQHSVIEGNAVTVFLDDRGTSLSRLLRRPDMSVLDALLEAQESSDVRIQLVPILVMWDRSPDIAGGQVRNFFLANRDSQGFATQIRNLYTRSRKGLVQAGEALDLTTFLDRVPDRDSRSKALHSLMRRYHRRESKLIRGPRLLPHKVMRSLILDNPPMRDLARREAEAARTSPEKMRRILEREYDAIAARFSWNVIRFLHLVLRPLWTRVFSGVDVREEDLERIRSAMRGGTAILVPCHKSHLDYVLLSWVFFKHDLIVPHVVAGMNLAIWPLSLILRGAGGFFIKRSFTGERIFPAVFSRYLRELIRHGYPVEFFIEGGRTRSGKLMRPRTGVLGMVLDAAEMRPHGHEVTILPIALAYEQVAEERAYAAELGGEDKRPESMGQLVKARSVLTRRYGRVYLRVGEPMPTSAIVDPTLGQRHWSERGRDEKREELYRIGERIIHRISEATVVLPTCLVALALLAHHRRGIRAADLHDRIVRFRALLARAGALEAASLGSFDQAIDQALDRFLRDQRIERFDAEGERVWGIAVDQRITLEFYKNQVLHFFAPATLAAAAIRGGADTFAVASIKPRFLHLIWLFRREFFFDPDRSGTELLDEGLGALEAHGAITRTAEGGTVCDTALMGELYGLIRPLLESYALVLRSGERLSKTRPEPKTLIRDLQRDEALLLAAGTITRPEALSLVSLKNAVDSLAEDGAITRVDGILHDNPPARLRQLDALRSMVM
jgi:glycerol-3-phosphate O-acyltransferase